MSKCVARGARETGERTDSLPFDVISSVRYPIYGSCVALHYECYIPLDPVCQT